MIAEACHDAGRVDLIAPAGTPTSPPDSATLEIQNRKIVVFRAPVGATGPEERAAAAAYRIQKAMKANLAEVTVRPAPEGMLVLVGDRPAFAATPDDVDTVAGVSVEERAAAAAVQLRVAIAATAETRSVRTLLRGLLFSLLAIGGLALVILGLLRARRTLLRLVESRVSRATPRLTIRGLTLPRPDHLARSARAVVMALAWVGGLSACYACLTFVLTRFPRTRPWGEALGHYLLATVRGLAGPPCAMSLISSPSL